MFNYIKNIFIQLLKLIKPNIWILENNDKATQKTLKIIYIGSSMHKNYIVRTVFNDACDELYLGKKFIWHAYYLVSKNRYKCSLAIIEGTFLDKFLYNSTQDFLVPIWIESFVDLPLVATNKAAKEDFRRVRKNKLEYIVTRDSQKIYDFYHDMYSQITKVKYKNEAFEISYNSVVQKMKKKCTGLLLIKKEDTFISGSIINRCSDIPNLWINGIKDTKYMKDRALVATYIFPCEYLCKQGYKKLSFGYTRSFLNDGVLNYKKKWQITLKTASQRGYILKPLKATEALEDFFISNPFIYMKDNKLYGAVFINENENYSQENYEKFKKQYYTKGLSELNIFSIKKESGFIKKRQQDVADFK